MLLNNPVLAGEYRHNYIRLAFLIGTLVIFVGYIAVNQLAERGNNRKFIVSKKMSLQFKIIGLFPNTTLRAEELVLNDITPSDWVYRALDAFNYLWQVNLITYRIKQKTHNPFSFSYLGFYIH